MKTTWAVSSVVHISQTSVDILDALVFLNILAEWTATLLNVSELIFILEEELAALIANCHGNIRDHVFVVFARPLRAELTIVDNEHLFKAHAFKDPLI
jgi:hypothetical protein